MTALEGEIGDIFIDGSLEERVRYNQPDKVTVYKFLPGSHFHVLGTKFQTFQEAEAYAWRHGHRTEPLVKEVHVYRDWD